MADSVLILGLTAHYLQQGAALPATLLLISLVAAMLVSYVRARAEALGFSCKVGLLTRMERIFLVGALSGLGLPLVMVWALAVLSVFTVFQRIIHIYTVSRLEETSG
jgi:CDP-diacylglycerol--glycerol-3-phosphate 3-phosphatidyltransferase